MKSKKAIFSVCTRRQTIKLKSEYPYPILKLKSVWNFNKEICQLNLLSEPTFRDLKVINHPSNSNFGFPLKATKLKRTTAGIKGATDVKWDSNHYRSRMHTYPSEEGTPRYDEPTIIEC